MTPRQRAFIESLLRDRDVPEDLSTIAANCLATDDRSPSNVIDALLACPRVEATRADEEARPLRSEQVPVGIYEMDEGLYAVRPNRAKTARYALEIRTTSTGRITEAGEEVHVEFEYAAGIVNRLTLEHRCSVERAEDLSLRFGKCICCGHGLKVADSVRQGVGPVCKRRYF